LEPVALIFRSAVPGDVPSIARIERFPEFRTFVGTWSEERHLATLEDMDAAYVVAEDASASLSGFAILLGLKSEHRSLELKRLVVATPNQGLGRKLLEAAAGVPGLKCASG
jgi:hypothetical protein